MKTTDHWKTQAKQLIRAEMKRRSLSYADLASRMQGLGLAANERTLANKIAAGGFSAAFFLQCMGAIGVRHLQLGDDDWAQEQQDQRGPVRVYQPEEV
jgi:hypothetical protein